MNHGKDYATFIFGASDKRALDSRAITDKEAAKVVIVTDGE